MWAIEFGDPGSATWRMLERAQRGIFAQLVVVPLFKDHRILSQVAGHNINVVKGMPPLTIGEDDIEWFASALEQVVDDAQKLGRAATKFALNAARAGLERSRA